MPHNNNKGLIMNINREEIKGAFPPLEVKQLKKQNLANVSARYQGHIVEAWERVFKSIPNSNKNATIEEAINALPYYNEAQIEIFKRIPIEKSVEDNVGVKNIQYRVSQKAKNDLDDFIEKNNMSRTEVLSKLKVLIIENHT